MAEFVLVWLACAVLCGVVAVAKDRFFPGWFAFGLVFGVFAVIVLLCLPNLSAKHEKDRQRKAWLKASKTCPACAERVRKPAKLCRFCGHPFEPAPATAAVPEASAPPAPHLSSR